MAQVLLFINVTFYDSNKLGKIELQMIVHPAFYLRAKRNEDENI